MSQYYYISSNNIAANQFNSYGTTPTISTGPIAGPEGYISNTSLTGTNAGGQFYFQCQGTAAPGDTLITVTFTQPYSNSPSVVIVPSSLGAADLSYEACYYVNSTPTNFSLLNGTYTPITGTLYDCRFNYFVINNK